MQISIRGVPTIAVNKVMRDLSVTIHYLNKYVKKIWALSPAVPQSPTDCIDAGHDQDSECFSKPGNDTPGNADALAFNNQGESEAELQVATMHSPSDIERKSEAFQGGRMISVEEPKLLDREYLFVIFPHVKPLCCVSYGSCIRHYYSILCHELALYFRPVQGWRGGLECTGRRNHLTNSSGSGKYCNSRYKVWEWYRSAPKYN